MTTSTTTISIGDWHDTASVMPVMTGAFDSNYGEAWSETQLAGLLMLPGSWIVLVRVDGRIAGFAVARATLDEAELMLLAVAPDARGQGLGQRLLDEVIAESRRRDVHRIFLEMRSDNVHALSLYAHAGFIPVGYRPRYYRGADGVLRDAITMTFSLG